MKEMIFQFFILLIGMSIGAFGVLLYLYKTSTREKQKRLDIFKNIISLLQGNKCSFR